MLIGHEVASAKWCGWSGLQNGDLMTHAASAGFDVLLTVDTGLIHQQNRNRLPIAVVLIREYRNDVDEIAVGLPGALAALSVIRPGEFIEIDARRRGRHHT
jgi:hypothetical protein